ncbi:MAG: hypothetical protein H7Z13_08015 [Ferruginibacter sp.]|nr:hypothetical protein [Ferruginibacter sp.]
MKEILSIIVLIVLFTFSSCNGKKTGSTESIKSEENKTDNNDDVIQQPDENKNTKWEERKAKGDTLAMPYKDLQAYLPNISGYTKDGGASGSQVNMPGMGSWSETEQKYVSGDKRISVKLMDYNGAFQTFQGLTMAYGMAFSSEDDTRKQEKVELGIKNVAAYGTVYKTEKRAEVTVVAADRFLITIETNGDNDEAFLKTVARSINLDTLAGM